MDSSNAEIQLTITSFYRITYILSSEKFKTITFVQHTEQPKENQQKNKSTIEPT